LSDRRRRPARPSPPRGLQPPPTKKADASLIKVIEADATLPIPRDCPYPSSYEMSDTLPGCLGRYGAPMPPNGPCREQKMCEHISKHFIAREELRGILRQVMRIEAILRG
jgi:hypothetical protein